jgi:hypothetical protein
MASTKVQRIMTQPINLIFRFLQSVRTPALFGFLSRALAAGPRIDLLSPSVFLGAEGAHPDLALRAEGPAD